MKEFLKNLLDYIFKNQVQIKETIHEVTKVVDTVDNVAQKKVIDGNITLSDFTEVVDILHQAWLSSTHESESVEEVFTAWSLTDITVNDNIKLVPIQQQQSTWACVFYAIARMIMYNTNMVFTVDQIEVIKKKASDAGLWKVGEGITFVNGLKIWQEYIKEFNGTNVYYIRESIGSKEYERLSKTLNYMSIIGGYISKKYIADFKDDGIINAQYDFKEVKEYGHCFTDYKNEKNEIDNYPRLFLDKNVRSNTMQKEFVDHGYYFAYWYFMFAERNVIIDVVTEKSKLPNSRANLAKDLGIWNGENGDILCTRNDAASMVYSLYQILHK